MSDCRCARSGRVLLTGLLLMLTLVFLSAAVLAQQENPPKADLFAGYQWTNPGGSVPAEGPNGTIPNKLPGMPFGWGTSLTYNFSERWGLEFDAGGSYNKVANETTFSVGPRYTLRMSGANLFAHTLLGINRLTPKGFDASNGVGAVLGGGIDLKVSRPVTLRLIEADWVWGHHNFASVAPPTLPGLQRPSLSGARLRTGLVFNFGGAPSVPPAASCSVQPGEVMVGEPVTATAAASNFHKDHPLTYAWTSSGGKVTGKDSAASIDTSGMAGGSYTVTAHVTDPKVKKGGEASCSANFTVKEPPKNPPTMSCSANPSTVQVGTASSITCDCKSPDGVPVTVAGWTASGGNLSGSGATATLNTTGASAGPIHISATCTDSRGLTAPASTSVNVEVPPPPPPPPTASKLSQCEFPNKVKPWRVDNTCKAVLDDVALRLQQEADAKLVIVGNQEAKEKRKNLAGQRAVNSKAYLSGGEAKQAIDPSRIETRTGSGGSKTAEYWVVPSGATFSEPGTQTVDEKRVKAIPDHPRAAAAKKKAAKPKVQ